MKQYVSDMGIGDILFGAVVRFPMSAGCVKSVSLAEDDRDECILADAHSIHGHNGIKVNGVDIPILCNGDVLHKGQCVALVLADSEEKAREAAGRVKIVTDLPLRNFADQMNEPYWSSSATLSGLSSAAAVTTVAAVYRDDPAAVYRNAKRPPVVAYNRVATGIFDGGNKEEIEALFDAADKVTSSKRTLALPKCAPVHETCGALCVPALPAWRGAENSLREITVICPTPSTPRLRSALCRVLDLDGDDITVQVSTRHDEEVDYQTDITALLAAIGTSVTGKSTRLMLTRNEDEEYNQCGVRLNVAHTAAVKDGKVTAVKVSVEVDVGAYNPYADDIVQRVAERYCGMTGSWSADAKAKGDGADTGEGEDGGGQGGVSEDHVHHDLAIETLDLYKVPNMLIEVRAIATGRPPTGMNEKSLDALTSAGIAVLMDSLFDGQYHYMIFGKRRLAAGDVILAAAQESGFCRKADAFRALCAKLNMQHGGFDTIFAQGSDARSGKNHSTTGDITTGGTSQGALGMNESCAGCPFAIDCYMRYPQRAISVFTSSTDDGAVGTVVVETSTAAGNTSIVHIWLALEGNKQDLNDDASEAARLQVEKAVLCATGVPLPREESVTVLFVDTKNKNAKKGAAFIDEVSNFVYCLCMAAILGARH